MGEVILEAEIRRRQFYVRSTQTLGVPSEPAMAARRRLTTSQQSEKSNGKEANAHDDRPRREARSLR